MIRAWLKDRAFLTVDWLGYFYGLVEITVRFVFYSVFCFTQRSKEGKDGFCFCLLVFLA